ncbi:MAG TPA: GNAT family N-acetyltransferase [Candidatus Magasanikbacteria bacterium]|nr:GNAT family N-acetyltransferase [Candidatus Magasanikbacteria bacterium]
MKTYLSWKRQTLTDFSSENISTSYADGFVFTRRGKGEMDQTRSVRIDLAKFELSSENRRVLKKTDEIALETIPLPYSDYHWSIGKLAKDFYTTKFGDGTFSANKVKEILTDADNSNFNLLLRYTHHEEAVGYAICYTSDEILHYSYPFYELTNVAQFTNIGIGMMTKAIQWAKDNGKKYVYLGSAQRPTDTYKFQFSGSEWFDGERWNSIVDELKKILSV